MSGTSPLRIQAWTEADFNKYVEERWKRCQQDRRRFEDQWSLNERAFYNALGVQPQEGNITVQDLEKVESEIQEKAVDDIAINYIFQYIRYNHSLMSANPPEVVIKPYSNTMEDKQKAELAGHSKTYIRDQYNLVERTDERNLKTLTKGTGYLRMLFDSTKGDLIATEGDQIWLEGDISVYSPSTWDIWLGPARNLDELPYFFERIKMDRDEAVMRWPEHKDKILGQGGNRKRWGMSFFNKQDARSTDDSMVDVFLYLERGLAVNGLRGRRCYRLQDGTLLEYGDNKNPEAALGLDVLTDIDVEDELYGKSLIEYLEPIQEVLSALDTNDLANVAIHNVVRLIVDGDAEMDDEAVTDSTVDIIQLKNSPGLANIKYLDPPGQMPDSVRIRNQMFDGQKSIAGMNDAMTGQLSRETSGYQMDRSIESGNMVRRRLYNKYTKSTRNVYMFLLNLAINEWTLPKLIKVSGEDNTWFVKKVRGADIAGGWDIDAQYGRSFSLDPQTKRQEIMQLIPMLEKVPGFDYGSLAREWGLDIFESSMFDRVRKAHKRQQKIFDDMISRWNKLGMQAYVEPREFEDHINMYDYCRYFYMTEEFDKLDEDLQSLIEQHITERREYLAKEAAANQAAQQPPQMPAA